MTIVYDIAKFNSICTIELIKPIFINYNILKFNSVSL